MAHWSKNWNFHGNLKSSNIFLDKNYEVEAIGDFYINGLTGFNMDDIDLKTIKHLSPEFISLGKNFDQKSDAW